jgi:predicted ATPase
MIQKLHVENFMSLKDTVIEFDPLTIFIGSNAAGKSAIFKSLVTLTKLWIGGALRGPQGDFYLENGVTLDDLVWNGNSGLPIRFSVWFDKPQETQSQNPDYFLELRKERAGWSVTKERVEISGHIVEVKEGHPFVIPTEKGEKEFPFPMRATMRFLAHPFTSDTVAQEKISPILEMGKLIGRTWRYRPSAEDIAAFVPPQSDGGGSKKLHVFTNGWGLARELQTLQGANRDLFTKVENRLKEEFEHIRTIGFDNARDGVRLLFTTNRSGRQIPAPQECDGVLLTTFLLWRLYTSGSENMQLCLEEPENGLYPNLMGERFSLLRDFTQTGKLGQNPVQILVATHSWELLRLLEKKSKSLLEEIRYVEFDATRGTQVIKLKNYKDREKMLERIRGQNN